MRGTRSAALLVASLTFAPSSAAPTAPVRLSEILLFEEIARGEISGFQYNFPDFAGAELHITDRRSWAEFWNHHTRGTSPAPPLPDVRFSHESVIVVLLGYQTTGGGPSIGAQRITRTDRRSSIEVLEDRAPGPLTVITNPYQIIVTRSLGGSITFVHTEPGERLCQDHVDCPAERICSRVDPTCQSPVTGRCLHYPPGSACPTVLIPVCGCDGKTYSNACFLDLEGAVLEHVGECL